MKAYKNLSQFTIEDMASMMRELQSVFDKYSHVSDHIPKELPLMIDKTLDGILKEIEEREDQY